MTTNPLLKVRDLAVEFQMPEGVTQAVDNISYNVNRGETVAIVGESGSGKSVSALAVMGLLQSPPASVSGEIIFQDHNLSQFDEESLRKIRGHGIGMVFQEPMTSLNPVLSIETQLSEGMQTHLGFTSKQARRRAIELLDKVGISEPERRLKQYPHHFSGGMRQRVMIAIALACKPKLIIADEPTTALDVTIQAQILQLMKDITVEFGVSLVLITHDLGVVARYATRVNVMYAGRIVESGDTIDLFREPRHPYTLGLLSSVPRIDQDRSKRLVAINGQPPDLTKLDRGCSFYPRCNFAINDCSMIRPELVQVSHDHGTACICSDQLP